MLLKAVAREFASMALRQLADNHAVDLIRLHVPVNGQDYAVTISKAWWRGDDGSDVYRFDVADIARVEPGPDGRLEYDEGWARVAHVVEAHGATECHEAAMRCYDDARAAIERRGAA